VIGQWSPTDKFEVTHDITSYSSVGVIYCWTFADETNIYVRQFNGSYDSSTIFVKLWAYPNPEYNGHSDSVSDSTAFNFDSDYNYLGLFKSGVIEGDDQIHVIPHNLGYVPQCKVWDSAIFVIDGGDGSVMATGPAASRIDTSDPSPRYVVDENNLTIGKAYALDGKIYYHIYINEA
jgi:hypothetical protein